MGRYCQYCSDAGFGYSGNDININPGSTNKEGCQDACRGHIDCVVWTFGPQGCFLHHKIGQRYSNNQLVSGPKVCVTLVTSTYGLPCKNDCAYQQNYKYFAC